MSRTANFRRQHDALMEAVGELQPAIAEMRTLDDARRITGRLERLTGILQVHLAAEDKSLYPRMMASEDERTARTANSFAAQMGDLGADYLAFADRWSSSEAVFAEHEAFARQSAKIFAALGRRIERENEELYPLADAMTDPAQRAA